MLPDADHIQVLREALQVSPENVPLRLHVAEMLLGLGRAAEAQAEFVAALQYEPEATGDRPAKIKLGLARAYEQQGLHAQALVLLEELTEAHEPDPAALSLHSRLLMRTGQVDQAVQRFRQALEKDSSLQHSDLAQQLGIDSDLEEDWQEGDWRNEALIEGMMRLAGGEVVERDVELERPPLTFADVGGMESLKEAIRLKIIYPLSNATLYKAYGKGIGGGILLYGPPGCGKTHLARATAGEIRANFIPVGANDVLDMWLGNSERNLHDLFEQARDSAPCVLFFDEVDALAGKRTDLRQSAVRQTINQFLSELDGVQYSNEGVLVLAATNAPWHLDSAFRRPGRFDRILFVPPPDQEARAAVLRLLCKGRPIEDLDFERLAQRTNLFSGADLKAVVDRAVEHKLQEALQTGDPQPLTTQDLLQAVQTVRPSTREWLGIAKRQALHGNQDGTYDEILSYLDPR